MFNSITLYTGNIAQNTIDKLHNISMSHNSVRSSNVTFWTAEAEGNMYDRHNNTLNTVPDIIAHDDYKTIVVGFNYYFTRSIIWDNDIHWYNVLQYVNILGALLEQDILDMSHPHPTPYFLE